MHQFLSEIISETSQAPIKTFRQHFEQKIIIFSDISLPRLGKNMSIAMQNMTESQKQTNKQTNKQKNSKLCPSIIKSLVID